MVAASCLHNGARYFQLLLCQHCFLLLWSVYLQISKMIYAGNYFRLKRHSIYVFIGTILLLNFA